jgi:allantoin racemase
MKKIRVIIPTTTESEIPKEEETFQAIGGTETEISVVCLDHGSDSVENDFDIGLALPDILSKVEQAEREGIQAVIIFCMTDLGSLEARRFASIPVIGPAEASLHYATLLAHNFSILGVIPKDLVFYDRLLRRYNIQDRLASIPIIDIPVLDLLADTPGVLDACLESSLRAIREDGAAAIILGFAGMPQSLNLLQGKLAESGYAIPVINPTFSTLRMAECLIDLEITYSN